MEIQEEALMLPKVAVDIDGVICDCKTLALRYNQILGFVPQTTVLDDIKDYHYSVDFPDWSWEWLEEGSFWLFVEPFPGAKDDMERLREFADFTYISACGVVREREAWLWYHGFAETYLYVKSRSKARYFKEHGYEAVIEDQPKTLYESHEQGVRAYCVAREYNVEVAEVPGIFRGTLAACISQLRQDFCGERKD